MNEKTNGQTNRRTTNWTNERMMGVQADGQTMDDGTNRRTNKGTDKLADK